MTSASIRELRDDEIDAAIGVIARGMRDNPLHIGAFGRDAELRRERLARLFRVVMPMIFANGVVLGAFQGMTLTAVAGIVASDGCQPGWREKIVMFPRLLPVAGLGGFLRLGRWTAAWSAHDLAERHLHLGPVAVDAQLQGKGIGSALMREYCARLDRLKIAGYLETDKPENVRFYEKFGFGTIAEAPVIGLTNWFMKREHHS